MFIDASKFKQIPGDTLEIWATGGEESCRQNQSNLLQSLYTHKKGTLNKSKMWLREELSQEENEDNQVDLETTLSI